MVEPAGDSKLWGTFSAKASLPVSVAAPSAAAEVETRNCLRFTLVFSFIIEPDSYDLEFERICARYFRVFCASALGLLCFISLGLTQTLSGGKGLELPSILRSETEPVH
jgi:hypothetical protein